MDVSNPDKVMFPETGTTKARLVEHYETVAPLMLPWVSGRPLTLERYPGGTAKKGFFQKNASKHFPASIQRVPVPKNDGTVIHPVIDAADDLAYLANQGTVTFHVWTSKVPDLDHPDHLVLDLDPSEEDLSKIREVAEVTRSVMERFGLAPVLVASGSRGFHLWAAIQPDHDFAAVARAAWCLAALVAAGTPGIATTEFLKRERGNRVFVDWLRNRWAQSIACPYSVRSRPAPTLAVPLRWVELGLRSHPAGTSTPSPIAWPIPPAPGSDSAGRRRGGGCRGGRRYRFLPPPRPLPGLRHKLSSGRDR